MMHVGGTIFEPLGDESAGLGHGYVDVFSLLLGWRLSSNIKVSDGTIRKKSSFLADTVLSHLTCGEKDLMI